MAQDQEELVGHPAWFRAAFESTGDAVIVTDSADRVIFLNPVAQSMTGWPAAEAAGKPLPDIFRIVNETTRRAVEDPVAKVLATGVVVGLANHTVLVARDGSERSLEGGAASARDQDGKIVGAILVFRNVSERRQVAHTLVASETRYRRLFETAQDGILILDVNDRRILDANPFLTEMLGFTHNELVGKELWEIGLLKDIAASKAAFRELQERGYIRYEDLPLKTKDGRGIEVEFVSNVYAVDGRSVIQCNIRDVTDRKRAEGALQDAHTRLEKRVEERTAELAQSNEALKAEVEAHKRAETARVELLRRLVDAQEEERQRIARELHDQMGQHLAALILGLKVLEDAAPKSVPARSRLQQLQQLADLIGKEVHHLALQLRPTALDDLGLNTALRHYVEQWSERSGVEVDFHSAGLDGERLPPDVETAVYRIVQEALTNVLKHAQARRVNVVLQRSSAGVHAIVEDDGRGFEPDGETSPVGGRGGLGLLGMRERAALAWGTLAVESTPGNGTSIFVRIPAAGEPGGGRP